MCAARRTTTPATSTGSCVANAEHKWAVNNNVHILSDLAKPPFSTRKFIREQPSKERLNTIQFYYFFQQFSHVEVYSSPYEGARLAQTSGRVLILAFVVGEKSIPALTLET